MPSHVYGAQDFDHVLLTRFSAVLAPGGAPAGEEWLRYRLGFFYDATYPSVISQSVDDPIGRPSAAGSRQKKSL